MFNLIELKNNKKLQFLVLVFAIFSIWRITLFFHAPSNTDDFDLISFSWGATYQIIAIIGAVLGFIGAKYWGGWKSMLGRVMMAFSFGLIFQSIGQALASFYVYEIGDVPYPGLSDIGFFGSVLFYIYGVIILLKMTRRANFLGRSLKENLKYFILPILMLAISYVIFLKGYQFDFSQPIKVILDFGYPLGQALYIAIAILVYILSLNYLGGAMKKPIMFLIIALVAQYLSDFTFLYQASRDLYIPEGINDCMYFISYFLMALSLIKFKTAFDHINES